MITELDYSVLKRHTNIEDLGDEVKALDDNSLIGQSTGEEALKFGLNVKSKGYNIYVAGANGSGKTSFAEKFAREMFKAGSNLKDKSPEEIFYQDYKKFIAEDEINFGVGQISSMDSDELVEIKERLVPFMVSECGRHGVTRVFFMLTNIIEESTELLYYGEGSEEMARIAFHMEPKDGVFDLKGVVSRKKQLIPALMEAAQAGQNDYN